MLRKVILQNRAERDAFLKRPFLMRDGVYRLRDALSHSLCKVVVGPRRAGKSVMSFLALKEEKFAYLNFDDEALVNLADYDIILEGLEEVYGDVDFFFFDEIQNLANWELLVNKLQRRGYNLILTGSNARLLSRELGTALTGRYMQFQLLPLGLGEFLRSRELDTSDDLMGLPQHSGKILRACGTFLKNGGFPEVAIDGLHAGEYLGTLIDAILYKDITIRHNIRSPRLLTELCSYLLSNFAREFTYNSLKNALGANSRTTMENYFSYLQDAYLIFSLERYSFKIKETIRSPRKVYIVDNGLLSARARQATDDYGHLLENAVFLELVRQGNVPNQNLFYYHTKNNLEVDFLLLEDRKPQKLIQVAYGLDSSITEKREINALIKASQELRINDVQVVTWAAEDVIEIEKDNLTIEILPFWKFA